MDSSAGGFDSIVNNTDARGQWEEESRKLGRFQPRRLRQDRGRQEHPDQPHLRRERGPHRHRPPGHPVQQPLRIPLRDARPLRHRGFELGLSADEILAELRSLIDSKRTADAAEHIHAAYYCVRAGDHRLEPAEREFISGLHELGIPVFLVLTQVHKKGEVFRPEHAEFAQFLYNQNLPIYLGRPFLTAALPDPTLGYESHGINELVAATYQAAPEAASRRWRRRRSSTATSSSRPPGSASRSPPASPPPWEPRPSPSATQRCWCPSRPG